MMRRSGLVTRPSSPNTCCWPSSGSAKDRPMTLSCKPSSILSRQSKSWITTSWSKNPDWPNPSRAALKWSVSCASPKAFLPSAALWPVKAAGIPVVIRNIFHAKAVFIQQAPDSTGFPDHLPRPAFRAFLFHIIAQHKIHHVRKAGRCDIMESSCQRLGRILRKTPHKQSCTHAVVIAGIALPHGSEQRKGRIFAAAVHSHIFQAYHFRNIQYTADYFRYLNIVIFPHVHMPNYPASFYFCPVRCIYHSGVRIP